MAGKCSSSRVCAERKRSSSRCRSPHGSHVCRFEKLFQERRNGLQVKSIKFLLFIKEKLALDTDPEKDEWISTQATRAMETFAPEKNREFYPGVVDIVRWKGLHFASSVYVMLFPSFRGSSFTEAP